MEQETENSIQLSTATAPTMKQPRNCAFDIARIVAMFLIVSSHFLGHGGFANNMMGANLGNLKHKDESENADSLQ